MLTNHPEGRPWRDYLGSTRYICRLDNFPYKDLAEIDHLTKHRLRRFRGVPVGEATGLGVHYGHSVKIDKELEDIGLFIAAHTALDCARTALRITKANVTIIYRRTENDMPADPVILDEAKEEGIKFRFLAEPKSYEGVDDRVVTATMSLMQLGEPDESGRRKPNT